MKAAALLLIPGLALAGACTRSSTAMTAFDPYITQVPVARTPSGEPISVATFRNQNGMRVRTMNYGGIIMSIEVPDKTGAIDDVVLGHDAPGGYIPNPTYFGAIIGRYANRIAKGQFTLDGTTYHLPLNNGPNSLHGGTTGWDQALWDAAPFQDKTGIGVVYTLTSKDGDQGYPGTVKAKVTYTLKDDNRLVIDYAATTDKPTVINMTQHAYFNLGGRKTPDILGHVLTINADKYTPVDATLIPTGQIADVSGTPFDFRTPTAIGARINEDNQQLKYGPGYDHNWVIDRPGDGLVWAAKVYEPVTGRTLEVDTTEPGLQFYSGNFLDGTIVGKHGVKYGRRSGFTLETQHFPDSPNHPNFPSTVLRPGQTYASETVFTFGVRSGS